MVWQARYTRVAQGRHLVRSCEQIDALTSDRDLGYPRGRAITGFACAAILEWYGSCVPCGSESDYEILLTVVAAVAFAACGTRALGISRRSIRAGSDRYLECMKLNWPARWARSASAKGSLYLNGWECVAG